MGSDDGHSRGSGTRAFGSPAPAPPAQVNRGSAVAAAHSSPSLPDPSSQDDPLIGQTLAGRYQIERKLGEGGMGSVYLGFHVALEKRLALKVLHGEFARKADLIERFLQEAKAASKIRHEHVIDITDFGQTEDGLVFFAMELLDGSDLAEELAHRRLAGERIAWERTRHIFLQICSALSAAHGKGIVHRDLKPENIYLIERIGQPDFVKLLDFGIAKLTEVSDEGRKLTKTGMLFGTPEYMSPEQARGEKVDHRVDIYAMGCILFQMITGQVPFVADNFMGILTLHLTQPTPLMGEHIGAVGAPPGLEAVVQRALAKEREDRYGTIDEMIADILSLEDGLGARMPTHGVAIPRAASDGGSAPVAVPVGPARTQWTGSVRLLEPGTGSGAESALPEAAGKGRGLWIALSALAAIGIAVAIAVMLGRGGDGGQPAAPLAPTGATNDQSAAPTAPEKVTITLKSTPPGATITDASGTVLGQTPQPFEMDKSEEAVTLTVTLEGYEPREEKVTPNATYRSAFDLTPVPDSSRSGRTRRSRDNGTDRSSGDPDRRADRTDSSGTREGGDDRSPGRGTSGDQPPRPARRGRHDSTGGQTGDQTGDQTGPVKGMDFGLKQPKRWDKEPGTDPEKL